MVLQAEGKLVAAGIAFDEYNLESSQVERAILAKPIEPYSLFCSLPLFLPFRHFPISSFLLGFVHFAFFPLSLFAPASFAATVAAVIDGDTIRLSDERTARYLGINTPEYGQPFYEEAKRFNEQLVLGKRVRLETDGRGRDRYGRELTYVYVGEALANEQVIAEGWGHVFVIGSFPRAREWLRLQKNAQDQRKGIWREGLRGPLKITTVRADADGDDQRNPNGEYVRLCNVSDSPVRLQGFSVQDAERHRFVFSSGSIEPGYTALLLSGKGRNTMRRGQWIFYWKVGPIWNNDGDAASLFDPSGKLIDSFRTSPGIRE